MSSWPRPIHGNPLEESYTIVLPPQLLCGSLDSCADPKESSHSRRYCDLFLLASKIQCCQVEHHGLSGKEEEEPSGEGRVGIF